MPLRRWKKWKINSVLGFCQRFNSITELATVGSVVWVIRRTFNFFCKNQFQLKIPTSFSQCQRSVYIHNIYSYATRRIWNSAKISPCNIWWMLDNLITIISKTSNGNIFVLFQTKYFKRIKVHFSMYTRFQCSRFILFVIFSFILILN